MKILYVTSEAAPFAQSGGLGDVLGALPFAVGSAKGDIQAECILPLYKGIKDEYKMNMRKALTIEFMLGWRKCKADIYVIELKGVTYYFVENHYYFGRDNLYGEYDDAERFAFFGKAVAEFVKIDGFTPDILHANDWQGAPSIIYLKTQYPNLNVKTVFTIHNIEFQGKFDPYILGDVFGLGNEYLGLMCYDGCINLMKAAMVLSDKVTTVSPNYACELQHEYFAFGLSNIVKLVSDKLVGIINGIDYSYFSPESGGDIDCKYTKRTVRSGKLKNKTLMLSELSLNNDTDKPLLVMISRLTEQKGLDLLLGIIDELLSLDLNLVVLGTGDSHYETALKSLEGRYSNLKALIKFDRKLSKRLYASADMLLMPSKFEPCGLSQMIACAYGTVPIVRSVGGLADTIIPYGNDCSLGFRFDNYNAHELLYTVKRACEVYTEKQIWHSLRKRAINADFSWQRSALDYIRIYEDLML